MTEHGDPQSTEQSSGVSTPPESPVLSRLHLVMNELSSFIGKSGDHKYKRFAWIADALLTEMFDELDGLPDQKISFALEQFGKVIAWCGNGDESLLPANVREYLRKEHSEVLAITAGGDGDDTR